MTATPWEPLINEWARALRAGNKSPSTIRIYTGAAVALERWCTTHTVADLPAVAAVTDVTRRHIREYIAHLVESTSAGNARTNYGSIQQWWRWLLAEDEIDANPMDGMDPPHVPEKPVPLVPDDLVRTVLDQCRGRDLISRRDTAIIRLIWDTGCRLAEIAHLTVDDVDLDLDVLHIVAKGRRPRTVPFGPKAGQALSRYLRVRASDRHASHPRLWLAEKGKGPLTANGIKLMFRRRGKKAGVNDAIGRNFHAHLGRHAFAHEWQANGGSEGDLMRLMGWRSPQMPKRYGASAAEARAQAAARAMNLGDRL